MRKMKGNFILLICIIIFCMAIAVFGIAPGKVAFAENADTEAPISQYTAEVVWDGPFESEYGESVTVTATYENGDGATVNANVIGLPNKNSDAGSYLLTATTDDDNCLLTNNVKIYTVTPKKTEVIWSTPLSGKKGENVTVTATYENHNGLSVNADIVGLPNENSDIGSYLITATTVDGNYELTNNVKIYEIIAANGEDIEELKNQIADLTEQIDNLSKQITQLNVDKTNLNNQVVALSAQIGNFESKIEVLQNSVDSLQTDNTAFKAEIQTLKAEIARMKNSVQVLQTENQRLAKSNQGKLVAVILLAILLAFACCACVCGVLYIIKNRNKIRDLNDEKKQLIYEIQRLKDEAKQSWEPNSVIVLDEVGKQIKKTIRSFSSAKEDIKYDYNQREVIYDCQTMIDKINSIERDFNNIVDALPNYSPRIGENYDARYMEEYKDYRMLGIGNVAQVVAPGKMCGNIPVRLATVILENDYEKEN